MMRKTYIADGKTDGWIHTIAPTSYTDVCGPYLQAYMTGDMSAEEVTRGVPGILDRRR